MGKAKSISVLDMAGWLRCTSKDAPFLLRLDAVSFLKAPESYGTKNSSGRPKTIFPCTEPEDPTGCQCRHMPILDPDWGPYWCWLQPNNHKTASARQGLQEQKRSSKATSPPKPQTCPFRICKGAPNMRHWWVEESLILWWEKIYLDSHDGFQSYWHDKEIPLEMFSTRHRGGGYIMIWGTFFFNRKMDL